MQKVPRYEILKSTGMRCEESEAGEEMEQLLSGEHLWFLGVPRSTRSDRHCLTRDRERERERETRAGGSNPHLSSEQTVGDRMVVNEVFRSDGCLSTSTCVNN